MGKKREGRSPGKDVYVEYTVRIYVKEKENATFWPATKPRPLVVVV